MRGTRCDANTQQNSETEASDWHAQTNRGKHTQRLCSTNCEGECEAKCANACVGAVCLPPLLLLLVTAALDDGDASCVGLPGSIYEN